MRGVPSVCESVSLTNYSNTVLVSMASFRPITAEYGHSAPPEGPHTITTHLPGWDEAIKFRDGDKAIFAKLRSLYPRFSPFNHARQVRKASISSTHK